MKKIMILAISVILLAAVAAAIYFTRDRNTDTPALNDSTAVTGTSASEDTTDGTSVGQQNTQTPKPSSSPDVEEDGKIIGDVIYTENIDLDSDGSSEKIEIMKAAVSESTIRENEGILVITSKEVTEKTVFVKKPEGLTGLFKSVEFQDIDGDGAKDVFIIIPDSGASFTLNYFYAYSYKLKRSLSFPSEEFGFDLPAFAKGFKFEYKGNGVLQVSNSTYGFKSNIDLKDNSNYSTTSEDNNKAYERSWVDPTLVDLGENSRLTLELNGKDGFFIRMPIPVFGLATVDLIGEIDLIFGLDSRFNAYMKGFELYDFNVNEKVKAGVYITP